MSTENYTPDMFPSPDRIVPHDEGTERLAEIRKRIEAMPDPQPISAEVSAGLAQLRRQIGGAA